VRVAERRAEARRAAGDERGLVSKAAAVLKVLPDLIFWISREGVHVDFYAGAPENLLVPPDRIIGSRVREVLPAEVADKIMAALERALATHETQVFDYQLEVGGRAMHFEARIAPSGPDEAVSVIRDVSDRIRMQAQLAIGDRLAALGTLAAGVAHEINNPLTYILIGVESVIKELRKSGDRPLGDRAAVLAGRLDGALEGARRVRRIVADLRGFSRVDADDTGAVDVAAVLDAVVSLVESQFRYRGRLVKRYAAVPPVRASGDRLNQVFLNLLINAAQALPEGHAPENLIEVALEPAGDRVCVAVSDTGQGIPPDALPRIFDPFFTTKPIGIGTGLGLWICHGIVAELGGEIVAESVVGKGTTFRVYLPVAEAAAPPPAPAPIEDEPWRGGRILILDDEDRVASALGLCFEGSEVVITDTARAALARIRAGVEFDWIFCDVMMPDGTGMEVHAEVRASRPEVAERMIFMTGGAFTPRTREFLAGVDNPVLPKPFRREEVIALIRARAAALRARRRG
jgi:signal transduction histidine kinase/ActR/RegA family two-component response regulator